MEEKKERKVRRRCDNCQCWQRDGVDGICRAHAPSPVIRVGAQFDLVWPRTAPDEFCFDCFGPVK